MSGRSSDMNLKLLEAAWDGDKEEVEEILNRDLANINTQLNSSHETQIDIDGAKGATPLLIAAHEGHTDVVKALLNHDADINRQNHVGETPLIAACAEGHLDVVKLLSSKPGAQVGKPDKDGNTALSTAVEGGHVGVVQELIALDADIHVLWPKGHISLLHIAAGEGHLDVVEVLIAAGLDVNVVDDNRDTPLINASQQGQRDVVRSLIQKQAKIDAQSKNGYTALYWAASMNRCGCVDELINSRANVNAKGRSNRTPVYVAAEKGNLQVLNLLTSANASVNLAAKGNCSPLYVASGQNHLECVKSLLVQKADPNKLFQNQFSPIEVAAQKGHTAVVRVLKTVLNGALDRIELIPARLERVQSIVRTVRSGPYECIAIGSDSARYLLKKDYKTMDVIHHDKRIESLELGGAQVKRVIEMCYFHNSLYFTDSVLHGIFRLNLNDGKVKIFAGGQNAGHRDGVSAEALFNQPLGIDVDPAGNLYVADELNYSIRRISPHGKVETVLSGLKGLQSEQKSNFAPTGVLVGTGDHTGWLYVAGAHGILKVSMSSWDPKRLAGSSESDYKDGQIETARFNCPDYMAPGPHGSVFVADYANFCIRCVSPNYGEVYTLAGSNNRKQQTVDGAGSEASFLHIYAMAIDVPNQILSVVDEEGTLREIQLQDHGGVNMVGTKTSLSSLRKQKPKEGACDYAHSGPSIHELTCFSCNDCLGEDVIICEECIANCHGGHQVTEMKEPQEGFCNCAVVGSCTLLPPELALFAAVSDGDLSSVKKILKERAPNPDSLVQFDGGRSKTALIQSTQREHVSKEIVELLVSHGASVNKQDQTGLTPLMTAAELGRVQLCELLIQGGADVNKVDKAGSTALMFVAVLSQYKVVELLLQYKADINQPDQHGSTAVMYAAAKGDDGMVKLLMENNADIGLLDNNEYSTLIRAAEGRKTEHRRIIELLLNSDKCPDVNMKSKRGDTALVYAAFHGDVEMAKLLIGADGDVNLFGICNRNNSSKQSGFEGFVDDRKVTPLMAAASASHVAMIDLLIEHKADVGKANERHKTAIDYAMRDDVADHLQQCLGVQTFGELISGAKYINRGDLAELKQLTHDTLTITFSAICRCGPLQGLEVVVKALKDPSRAKFWPELMLLRSVSHHTNLIKLSGICMDFRFSYRGKEFRGPALLLPVKSFFAPPLSEYLDGDDVIQEDRQVYELALQMAMAVAHLHANDFIHRNLTLRSFLYSKEGTIFLTNLTCAKPASKSSIDQQDDGLIIPPWRWCPKETLSGNITHKPSDVYMFGVTLWELLGNRAPPYSNASSEQELLYRMASRAAKLSFSDQHIQCPPSFKKMIESSCAFDYRHRPTMSYIVEQLTQMIEDNEYDYIPPTKPPRLRPKEEIKSAVTDGWLFGDDTPPQSPVLNLCSKCGAEIFPDMVRCENCGHGSDDDNRSVASHASSKADDTFRTNLIRMSAGPQSSNSTFMDILTPREIEDSRIEEIEKLQRRAEKKAEKRSLKLAQRETRRKKKAQVRKSTREKRKGKRKTDWATYLMDLEEPEEKEEIETSRTVFHQHGTSVLTKMLFEQLTAKNEESTIPTDIIFSVGAERCEYPAHSFLFALHSEVLNEAIFTNTGSNVVPIELFGLSCEHEKNLQTFNKFFQFCYTGIVSFDANTVETLLEFAVKFRVPELIKSCGKFLKDTMTVTSVCWTLEMAHRYGIQDLYLKAMRYLKEHLDEVMKTDEFVRDLSREAFVSVLVNTDYSVQEINLFKGVIRWGKVRMEDDKQAQKEGLANTIPDLLDHIKFNHMTAEQLTKYVLDKGVVDADFLQLQKGHREASLLTAYFKDALEKFMKTAPTWTLLYNSKRHGSNAKDFHTHCDGKDPTVTLIKVKDRPHIFGGYSSRAWKSSQSASQFYQSSDSSFIFSLVSTRSQNEPVKYRLKREKKDKSILCMSKKGPSFGDGDIEISSKFHDVKSSCYPSAYTPPDPPSQNASYNSTTLAGNTSFLIEEIEIYQVKSFKKKFISFASGRQKSIKKKKTLN